MSPSMVAFLLFSVLAIGGAIRVVLCRRIFHGAMWLIVSFFGVAAVYMLLASPFLAGIQLFIYIGGVAVLTVIAIMVTKRVMAPNQRTLHEPLSAAVVSLALFGVMVWMIVQLPLPAVPHGEVVENGLALLGAALVDPQAFLLPFEVVSVMMLVVLAASLYLGRER